MKKTVIGILLVCISFSLSGKDLDRIISDFSKIPHSEKINVGSFAWSLIKKMDMGEDSGILKKISSISILDLENCSEGDRLRFTSQIDKLDRKEYELLMMIKDDGDELLILSRTKKDIIEEFILISKNDPSIIRIKGNFKLDDLAAVTKEYGTNNKK